jgi:branched-chain amino acid transport system substrate-binding protein
MQKKQIGVMLPASSIFPIGKEFEKGVADGLQQTDPQLEFELHKEFAGQGGNKAIEDACNKFFNYLDVDAVTGFVSNKVMELVSDKFQQKQKPIIASNVGGHMPFPNKLNEYVHINSMNLWAHAWALGHWGAQHIGGKGLYATALYDSGYSFSEMFHAGLKAGDPSCEWAVAVCKGPADKSLSDMTSVFEEIGKQQPDFVFATFCGEETQLFINGFIERGFHERTKLLGLPFLLSPSYPLVSEINIYTTVPFADPSMDAAKAFYHLGYRSGKALANAFNGNGDSLNGRLSLDESLMPADEEVSITMKSIGSQETKNGLVGTVKVPMAEMVAAKEETSFGWLNPYLCI